MSEIWYTVHCTQPKLSKLLLHLVVYLSFDQSKEHRVENMTYCTEFAFIKFGTLFYT